VSGGSIAASTPLPSNRSITTIAAYGTWNPRISVAPPEQVADHRADHPAVSNGQHDVGLGVDQTIGRSLTRRKKSPTPFAAGKGEIEIEGRPAIEHRRVAKRRCRQTRGFSTARSRLRGGPRRDAAATAAPRRPPFARHRSIGLQQHTAGAQRMTRSVRVRACASAAGSKETSVGADQLSDVPGIDPGVPASGQGVWQGTTRWASASLFRRCFRFQCHDRPSSNKKSLPSARRGLLRNDG